MNALSLETLCGGPDGVDVLNNVSTGFGPGLTGLVGPNGAGKTTLLRMCMGLLTPRLGRVYVGDAPLSTLSLQARARHIAYLPQNGPVHWAMSVRDLVELGRYSNNTSAQINEKAISAAMQACAVQGFASRTINTLSGGERSRVLLARALASETPIVLVDEPSNALDPAQQHRIMGILRDKAKSGVTVICALHDLPLAARYCDRLIFLRDGTIIEDGRPENVLTANSFSETYGLNFDKRGYLRDE